MLTSLDGVYRLWIICMYSYKKITLQKLFILIFIKYKFVLVVGVQRQAAAAAAADAADATDAADAAAPGKIITKVIHREASVLMANKE